MTTATLAATIAEAIHTEGLHHARKLTPALRRVAADVAVDIAEWVAEGNIPVTVASWGELASYVDHNMLGGADDLDWDNWTLITNAVDGWLAELPFTAGKAGVEVGDRVTWAVTPYRQGGGGVVTAVDVATVIVTTDDDVPVAFGTLHPRAEVLRAYEDIGDVTGYLSDLVVIEAVPPLAEDSVVDIEWTETVTHRTVLTVRDLRVALLSALAEHPTEVPESRAAMATADAATLVEDLRAADALGAVGGMLAHRNGRDALKVTGRQITSVAAR